MASLFKKHRLLCGTVRCSWTKISRFLSQRKRFYEEARICHTDGGYEVNLDAHKLRSPSGVIVKVPSEGLAHAVATEWNSQKGVVKLDSMPLTALCFVTLDSMGKRDKKSFVKSGLKFLATDTVLCHASDPPDFSSLIKTKWNPLIDWLNGRHQVFVKSAEGFELPEISPESYEVLTKYLLTYDYWSVVGFETMTNVLKSVVLSLAVLDRHVTVEDSVSLSRLEQEYQISKWGNVPWYHDVELMDMRMKTAACALFIQLCSEGDNYSSVKIRESMHAGL